VSDKLVDAIVDMKEAEALALTKQMLDSGTDPMKLLGRCREAMEIVGKRFEKGEYFVSELLMGGEILKQIQAMVKPKIKAGATDKKLAKVVFGTVAGDIHDLGKDIVEFMLDVNGFEVHDLGVDVSADKFVAKIKEVKPQVVGMSCLLTVAFDSMKATVEAIKASLTRISLVPDIIPPLSFVPKDNPRSFIATASLLYSLESLPTESDEKVIYRGILRILPHFPRQYARY